ncbi:hypothetical protein AGOR_G00239200 [Albula goreensis]|uniref:Uncharacterized protein n=1 Tax=Albula goreensis TaxID=1534307 RepID=A0A8T3CJF8_9TELE|nr:hypothetical protein AGOR_G00239200 [Albula goreensis]
MEESTFETFEDELGAPLQEDPPTKTVRQIRRPDTQAPRKMKEEPPSPQNTLKPVQKEMSRTMSIRRALSIQNLSQMESPWEGVTLNRCLFVAITILLISSGFQRLHAALKSLRTERDGERDEDSLALTRVGLRHDRVPPQPETSLWDSFFWWVLEDDEEEVEEDEESGAGKARKLGDVGRGGRSRTGRDKQQDTPGKTREKRDKRGRGREHEESAKGKRRREMREKVRHREEEDDEGEEEEEEEMGPGRKHRDESETQERGSESTATGEKSGRRGHRYALYDDTFKKRE